MTKMIISVSLSEYVFNTYLKHVKTNNRSNYVEQLIIQGSESMIGKDESLKSNYIQLKQEYDNLTSDMNKLKAELGRKESEIKRIKEKKKEPHIDREILEMRQVHAR